MNFSNFVFLTLSIGLLAVEVSSMCDESKLGEVIQSTVTCIQSKASQIGGNFQICNIIDGMFNNCGQLLRECMTDQEYRFFMDAQLKGFQQGSPEQQAEVQKCQSVQEFEKGGAGEGGLGGSQCSVDKIQQLINEGNQCSEKGATDFTTTLLTKHRNLDSAFDLICETTNKLTNTCFDKLLSCFPESQVATMKAQQKQSFRDIFLAISKSSEKQIDLDNCPSAATINSSQLAIQIVFVFISMGAIFRQGY